jgi:hypothetical protein
LEQIVLRERFSLSLAAAGNKAGSDTCVFAKSAREAIDRSSLIRKSAGTHDEDHDHVGQIY